MYEKVVGWAVGRGLRQHHLQPVGLRAIAHVQCAHSLTPAATDRSLLAALRVNDVAVGVRARAPRTGGCTRPVEVDERQLDLLAELGLQDPHTGAATAAATSRRAACSMRVQTGDQTTV